MKFIILSRKMAESKWYMHKNATEPYIWISIKDPDKAYAKSPQSSNRKASIFLAFDDSEQPGEFKGQPLHLITDKQAQKIVEFVDSWKKKVDLCVVNCEAGVSRSSGTALGLSMLINGHGKGINDNFRFSPNMLVRDKIIQHGEQLANENTPNWFRIQWEEENNGF